jgi:ABC-type transport system involved in multi-copper enzyme maturation permease subunit
MKYLAILKDSLREAIDSKVFFVVMAISALAVFLMATLSFTPNSPTEGLQKLAERFPDGSIEVDLPIIGKVKATEPLTEYQIAGLKEPPGAATKPWDAEYQFTLEARDRQPLGTRIAVLFTQMEEEQRKVKGTGKKTRMDQLNEEIEEEVQRIQAREDAKGGRDRGGARQQRIFQEVRAFIARRLDQELRNLPPEEMERFVKEQLENQGNWNVAEVKYLDLPPEERVVKIKRRVVVPEGEEEAKVKTEEVEGEVTKFNVKLGSRSGTYRVWPHKATLLFGAIPLGDSRQPGWLVYNIAHYLVGWFGAPVIMLLSCIITAFYIPNMLRKGTIDLLLAKPINRVSLLAYKYVGGLTFMFLNTVILIGGLWVALGIRSGIWEPSFLSMILILTFEFALFYAVSTLGAVLTRSPIVCILLCIVLWAVLWGLGLGYRFTAATPELKGKGVPEWVYSTATVTHAALPHYADLDQLGDKTMKETMLAPTEAEREKITTEYKAFNWGEALAVTSLYIAVFLGLACFFFYVRDY